MLSSRKTWKNELVHIIWSCFNLLVLLSASCLNAEIVDRFGRLFALSALRNLNQVSTIGAKIHPSLAERIYLLIIYVKNLRSIKSFWEWISEWGYSQKVIFELWEEELPLPWGNGREEWGRKERGEGKGNGIAGGYLQFYEKFFVYATYCNKHISKALCLWC